MIVGGARVEGLREVQRKIAWAKDEGLKKELRGANKDAATTVAEAAEPKTPYWTGRLARSIKVKVGLTWAEVRAGGGAVKYAPPIHWGWPARGIPARRFIQQALHEKYRSMVKTYEKALQAIADKVSAK